MTGDEPPVSREEEIVATLRAVLSKRLHAEVDAMLGDAVADVPVALLVPELTTPVATRTP